MAGPARAISGESATAVASLPPVVILSDDPTPADELGAHSRVAAAIAALIGQGTSAGRSVALTGSWGSGKSSIIEMLRRQLSAVFKPYHYEPEIFLFDAWAHQGDPLRRAFLECMIERAVQLDPAIAREEIDWPESARKMTRQKRWSEELDLITGRREHSQAHADRPLTGWGLAVAISLLLGLPLGASFLGKYDPSKYSFWHSNFAWLFMAAYAIPVSMALFAWAKGGFNLEALKALLLREATQDTTTTTVKTKEPSSVDFQRVFTWVAGYLLAPEARRLIVVVDNLDRIDAASAVSMWATMRIFFQLDGNSGAWKDRLWLVVPFDRDALSSLWTSAGNQQSATELVDSFLNKTFQITFHVSPAVLTKWKSYFIQSLEKAFPGKEQANERDAIFELFALKRTSPSPREIKIFINKISALRLQWIAAPSDQRVELPFLAAYILHQNEIGVDGIGLLTGDVPSGEAVNILERYKPGVDQKEKLAAAHFNVPPDEALQVLLGSRFSEALRLSNHEALSELCKSANFWIVFERFSRSQFSFWQQYPSTLTQIVNFLGRSEIERQPDKEALASIGRVWPTVISAAVAVSDWGDGSNDDQEAFPLMLKRAEPQDYEKIARSLLKHFENRAMALDVPVPPKEKLDQWLGGMRGTFPELRSHPSLISTFKIAIGDQLFLAVTAAALGQDSLETVLDHFTCAKPAEISKALAALLPASGEEQFLRLQSALAARVPDGWEQFDQAIIAALPEFSPAVAVTAIRTLLRPRGYRDTKEILRLIGSNAIEKLEDSDFKAKGQWREAGVLAAVAALASGLILNERLTNVRARIETNPAPELLDSMADALSDFQLTSKVLAKDFISRPLASPLLNVILSKGRFDELDPEDVISSYQTMPAELKIRVMQFAIASPKFLEFFDRPTWPTLGVGNDEFLIAFLSAIMLNDRERVALRLADMEAQLPVSLATVPLLNVLAEICGIAWLPLDMAGEFVKAIQQEATSGTPLTPARDSFLKYLETRIALGDRTVRQLLDSAEEASPLDREPLLDLAIDRARADYAAAGDSPLEALLAWGHALLARSRRGSWASARSYAQRAQEIFEQAGKL